MDRVRSMVNERPLVIFSKSLCPLCHTIKTFFSGFGVKAEVYELDEIPMGREIEQALSSQLECRPTVPAVFIGGELIGGLSEVNSLHLRLALMPMLQNAGAIWV